MRGERINLQIPSSGKLVNDWRLLCSLMSKRQIVFFYWKSWTGYHIQNTTHYQHLALQVEPGRHSDQATAHTYTPCTRVAYWKQPLLYREMPVLKAACLTVFHKSLSFLPLTSSAPSFDLHCDTSNWISMFCHLLLSIEPWVLLETVLNTILST